MHCPSCGLDTTLDQRFCRSCGMSLEAVGKLVAEHSSSETLKQEKSLTEKATRQRMYQALMWGMISFILGLAVIVVTRTFSLDKAVGLMGTFLLFVAMGLMSYGVLSAIRDGASPSRKLPDSKPSDVLPPGESTQPLLSEHTPVPLPSVTERTTQLIAAEDATKTRE